MNEEAPFKEEEETEPLVTAFRYCVFAKRVSESDLKVQQRDVLIKTFKVLLPRMTFPVFTHDVVLTLHWPPPFFLFHQTVLSACSFPPSCRLRMASEMAFV